jgi:antitoxin (DNA-binding transcriptional repressor) of toxin-antitoxin stability system
MSSISIAEIERDPQGFLRRVGAGEAFLVVSGQRAVAEVRPLAPAPAQPRPFGLAAGEFTVPVQFDDPLPEDLLKELEGA